MDDSRYRPLIHYSPPQGFMNDPNGLIFLDGVYHLYYQHNPDAPRPGNVHWGHASSRDLLRWRTHAPVLAPDARGQAFSGSMVCDAGNTSGLFEAAPGGVVAVYTRAGPQRQAQELACGPLAGTPLTPYEGNPVLDIGSGAFRDPKVFWHPPSRCWVMVIALARRHQIIIYTSPDLRRWREASRFGLAGLLGLDYECPDLVELPVEGGGSRWVLFISINPGAPLGGSAVQYFVGDFDGQRFTPLDGATRLLDSGPDCYALQTFANLPGETLAMAWMSNWLYAADTPAWPARGAMTLARRMALRCEGDHWLVVQRFAGLAPMDGDADLSRQWRQATGSLARFDWPAGCALELKLAASLSPGSRYRVRISNRAGEWLEAGFSQGVYPGFYVDRSGLRGFEHPFWMHKAIHSVLQPFTSFDAHLVLDQCSLELLGMEGSVAMSLLHFFRQPPQTVEVFIDGGAGLQASLQARALAP
ncbi:glycoside hydrolase family 32 protein [Bordetella trematum]|nr:glycoside hydrolase family 32 protein [Bordetella trematum]